MTLRAKPVVNRPHRSSREGESRRNFYLNVGFGLAVVLAVLILIGVVAVTWYSQHLAAAASVDGQTITRDDFTERAQIELWRLQQQTDRVNAAARDLRGLLIYGAAMGLHFVVNDQALREYHGVVYDATGRWILAAAPLRPGSSHP